MNIDFQAPIKTISEANSRDHWAVRRRRKEDQQSQMMIALMNNLHGRKIKFPCVVKLTRIGPNKLDGDNLQSAFKGIRDVIAKKLGVDDGDDEKVKWEYDQMPVRIRDYAVRVSITALLALFLMACGGGSAPQPTPIPASQPTVSVPTPEPRPPLAIFQLTEERIVEGSLVLPRGRYQNRVPGPAFVLKDGASLSCEPGTVIEESTAEATDGIAPGGKPVFTIVGTYAGSRDNGAASKGIRIGQGCTFEGARSDFNSAYQTVSLGNCEDCSVKGATFRNTRTIGVQCGGSPANGNHASNCYIAENIFDGVASQNAAIVNCVNCAISGNTFVRGGQDHGPGVTVIDVEPNSGDWIDGIDIFDNLIDCSACTHDSTPGIGDKVTNGIVINGGNPTQVFRRIRVFRNRIIGMELGAPYNRISYAGILLRSATDTDVFENTVERVPWGILADGLNTGSKVRNNKLIGAGSGSTSPIQLTPEVEASGNVIQ